VKVQTYLAADNPFDVVSQPEVCGCCAGRECFHRHGTYERYVEKTLRKVARFLCSLCNKTTSVLPAFVLPYRATLVKDVDGYFLADDIVDLQAHRAHGREGIGDRGAGVERIWIVLF
jgi:hypothetical protein